MPSTDGKLELKAKTSVVQTVSQPFVSAKGLTKLLIVSLVTSHVSHPYRKTSGDDGWN
jgi:hypothetical protein